MNVQLLENTVCRFVKNNLPVKETLQYVLDQCNKDLLRVSAWKPLLKFIYKLHRQDLFLLGTTGLSTALV